MRTNHEIFLSTLLGCCLNACGGELLVDMADGSTGSTGTADDLGTTSPSPMTSDDTAQEEPGSEATSETSGMESGSGGIESDAPKIDAFIHGLGHLTVEEPVPAEAIECMGDECLQDGPVGNYICDYTYYSVTENFDEFVAFQPNSATLWPGSIVAGKDASTGLLTAIGLPRGPVTFSLSLPNLTGSSAGHLPEPSLSSYRDEVKEILAGGLEGNAPANFAFELRQAFSQAEVSLAIGTDFSWGGSKIKSMFSFDSEQTKTRLVADFVQAYYTVDVDAPLKPSAFFKPDVTLDEIKAFMSVESPPMYVQSITYGRRAIFSIETEYSEQEVRAAMEATIKAIQVDAEVSTEIKNIIAESTMKVFVLGGDSEEAIEAVLGFDGLVKAILSGATFSAKSPGSPIAYKLAYLDNYGTHFGYTTEFADADCSLVPVPKLLVNVEKIYFHSNGCGVGDWECNNKYKIWAEGSNGNNCEFANQAAPIAIDDGQTIGIGKVCSFSLPKQAGSWLTVKFWADEDGKSVQASKTFQYDGGWSDLGAQGITGINQKGDPLDVSVFFKVSEG